MTNVLPSSSNCSLRHCNDTTFYEMRCIQRHHHRRRWRYCEDADVVIHTVSNRAIKQKLPSWINRFIVIILQLQLVSGTTRYQRQQHQSQRKDDITSRTIQQSTTDSRRRRRRRSAVESIIQGTTTNTTIRSETYRNHLWRKQDFDNADDSGLLEKKSKTEPTCTNGEIVFNLFLDGYPNHIGFMLHCNNQFIWNVQVGSYRNIQQYAYSIQTESYCFDNLKMTSKNPTCLFEIYDKYRDGLTYNNANNDTNTNSINKGATTVGTDEISTNPHGYFTLSVNDDVLIMYDGSKGKESCFSKLSYCFGPYCPKTYKHIIIIADNSNNNNENSIEKDVSSTTEGSQLLDDDETLLIEDSDSNDDEISSSYEQNGTDEENDIKEDITPESCQDTLQLLIQFDEYPADVSYMFVCNNYNKNETITFWNLTAGTYWNNETNVFGTITSSICLRQFQNTNPTPVVDLSLQLCSCTFTVRDEWGDGLISPTDNLPGYFQLFYNNILIASVDGSTAFKELSYNNIGPICQSNQSRTSTSRTSTSGT